jgi:hypothetical protein
MMKNMENVLGCKYNIDNGYLEVFYKDGSILVLMCEDVEAELRTTILSRAELELLLEENPMEYMEMALEGKFQEFCDLIDKEEPEMLEIIIQAYMKQGFSRATAEMYAREVYRG